jgi:hypothetical protein
MLGEFHAAYPVNALMCGDAAMMSRIMPAANPRITLFLLGFRQASVRSTGRWPSLELLAARGSGLHTSAECAPRAAMQPWQRDVLQVLSCNAEDFPSAPTSAMSSDADATGAWLHLQPVHMAMSVEGLTLQSIPTWSPAELTQLEPALREHCEQAGFKWVSIDSEVLLRRDALQVATVAPDAAAAHGLRGAQPEGADARRILQLSTELQMLVHEHPSQQARAARNQPPINALWLWGSGELKPTACTLPMCWSDELYLRGLYRSVRSGSVSRSGTSCASLPASLVSVTEQAAHRDALVVARMTDADQAEQQWCAPLLQALRAGVWRTARVYLDDIYFDVNRSQFWRLWRRARELTELRA